MKHLRKGDRFTENYCFWLYIIKTLPTYVTIIYASAPCIFPDDGKIEQITKKEFIEKFYYVYLVDRFNKFEHWNWDKFYENQRRLKEAEMA